MAPDRREGLTDQQRRAVGARGISVALSAGAGCGKTFVLTERFLAELEPDGREGPRLGQLVAITFTERAAREMRDRIRAACKTRLLECPEQQVGYWLELLRDIDSARISTIHSFCGSLLRSHAVEGRLDPRFRVLDQAQADTLLHELLDGELRDRLARGDEAVIELVVQFSLKRLHAMIARLLGLRQVIRWQEWSGETPEGLVARWVEYWRREALPLMLGQIAASPAAKTLLQICRDHLPDHPTMRERCRFLTQRLPNLPGSSDPQGELALIRQNAMVRGGGGKKVWQSEELYRRFADAAKQLRDLIDRLKEEINFDSQAAETSAEASLRLLGVAADIAKAYEDRKLELGVLDFDDLLIRAKELLVGPKRQGVRKRLADQIRLLLVDEFQDTDPLQVELVRALCDDEITRGKLFFVGDFKQSIYRFRGADPHVFRRLRRQVPEEGRLPLSLNFRSQPAVLDFVNHLFGEELGPEYEPLRPNRPQVSPTPAVELLWAEIAGDAAGNAIGQTERLRRLEADWIARRIRAMLDSGEKLVWDQQAARAGAAAARAVRPGDIALLFRVLSNVDLYEEALQRYGIDYYLVGGHAFYAQQEVFDLLNLLRSLNSACDEVSLAGVLRSAMFGLLDETLFWLANSAGGLHAGLMSGNLPAEISGRQRARVQFAADTLRRLRAIKDRVPIAQLILEALAQTGYDAVLLAEFLGERKLANLYKLIEQARSFDRSGIFTLADFITQLSEFVARQPDEPLAATCGESTDVVKLMTIHQSKGLEFPVVIVPDVGRKRRASSDPVAFSPELGPAVKVPGTPSGLDLHRVVASSEDEAEGARLLYVATTRAADYLVLSSGVSELLKASGPWMELIARRFDLFSGALRTAAGDAIVKVTRSQPPLESKRRAARRGRDLDKLAEKARKMAAAGEGRIPSHLDAVPRDRAAQRQFSFSKLSGEFHAIEAASPADPLEERPLQAVSQIDARQMGDLVHAVLAEIDFAEPGDFSQLLQRHAQRQLLDAADALAEPTEMIRRFLASDRARDIAAAKVAYPELEFLLAWPPGKNDPQGPYLQGFIDCIYQDAGGRWRLLDYKTNRVSERNLAAVAAGYEMQMLVYATAAERILRQPPVELVLHFLRPGLEYSFPWDDAARKRTVEIVNHAMDRFA